MPDIEISQDGILKLVNNLKENKATGPDGLSCRVLKECSEILSCFLYVLFENSLSSGCLPSEWKRAHVVPPHKSGPKNRVDNYRPISLLCVCSKILEHIIYSNLFKHLGINNFLNPNQHGFRSGLSCDTQLVEFYHDIAYSFDKGTQVDCVFLDFQKAFDVVPHKLLLQKVKSLNLPDCLFNWITDYLKNRKQAVLVNGKTSTYLDVTSGVPQGSVLGPLLFLIFINDIYVGIGSSIRLYADDCVMYSGIRTESDCLALQEDIDRISRWCEKWGMKLSIQKCSQMTFTRKRQPVSFAYSIGGVKLKKEEVVKYLGVQFSHNLSWSAHIDYVTAKANRMLNFLKRNFRDCPQTAKATLFKTNVRPILEYASVLWDPKESYLGKKIEQVQSRAARFVTRNYDYRESATALKRQLEWEPLSSEEDVFA